MENNNNLKRKINNIRNDEDISNSNKKAKITELEEQIIQNINNDLTLSDDKKNKKIKKIIIRNIQRDDTLTSSKKMELYGKVMISDYKTYIKQKEIDIPETSNKSKSFYDERSNTYGCDHYPKNCKIKYKCCDKWYTCKFCHNEKEFHTANKNDCEKISCLKCNTIQEISNECINCNIKFGEYFCKKCTNHNNFDNNLFHCNKCEMCIQGDKKEFRHCDSCNMCLHISIINNHKCIADRNMSNCPICHDQISDSAIAPMILESCNHIIHVDCFSKYMRHGYKCPICSKTITDFGFYKDIFTDFDNILEYERNEIPEEFKNTMVKISCNDCNEKTETTYHFELLKCQNDICNSYNTTIISIHHDYYIESEIEEDEIEIEEDEIEIEEDESEIEEDESEIEEDESESEIEDIEDIIEELINRVVYGMS